MNVNYESDLTDEEEGNIEKQIHAPESGSAVKQSKATLKVNN